MMTNRQSNIDTFYNLLNQVLMKFPKQTLDKLSSKHLPKKGVYFFFEDGETRDDASTPRVVRIGTHAAIANSNATLHKRLYNHKGYRDFTGNHRGSVFRKLVGYSLAEKFGLVYLHWGDRSKKNDRGVKDVEKAMEVLVSKYLHAMTFTVLEVDGPSSKDNDRAIIEQNTIALLSNFNRYPIDKCSPTWLGLCSRDEKVIKSGLWNSDYVERDLIEDKYFATVERHLLKMRNW
ncbi:hypothetical protein [Olivibacter sp. XZL3]|uniref:hypothetical protein n=1 Tax=Olivibacter sp. XZL3 TaxID=1735116 RepID=UPI001066E08C|nr:hypothetical protein [Olivibacter sp. XZL3]